MNALISLVVVASTFSVTATKGPDRSKPPAPSQAAPFTVPVPEKLALKNGIPVFFLASHRAPLVDVVVGVRAGGTADPSDRPGLASWTADMLTEGAGDRSAIAFADATALLGASIASGVSWDAARASLHVAASRAEAGIGLLADVVLRPRFEAAEWARSKAELRTQFMEWRDEPRALSSLAVARALYGDNHRFGLSLAGTPPSLEKTEVADLKAFHASRYRPESAFIVLVGDLDKARALALLEAAFGGWKAAAPAAPLPTIARAAPVAGREIVLVDKPGAAQSVVSVARHAPADLQELEPGDVVMNTLLGGSFTSRLNSNLREEHGYAYGARSSLNLHENSSVFEARASVATPVTAASVKEMLVELTRIRTPATSDEVGRARQFAAQSFPTQFASSAETASFWFDLIESKVPFERAQRFMAGASAIDATALAQSAKKLVDAEAARIVIVGDRKVIEPTLKELNVGAIRVLEIDALLPTR